MSKTVLITGGAGFIGSNLVHYLRARRPDLRLMVLDLLTYAGSTDSLPPDFRFMVDAPITFWHGNVCNPSLVHHLVERSDIIIHLAAETHVTRSIFDNQVFVETDVMGTQTLLGAVLKHRNKVERLIHVSTSEVYGTAIGEVIDEEHPLNPTSPYAAAKCAADRLVYSYVQTYGLPATIVRPFNNYGPRQHMEKLVPRFLTSALLEEPMMVHGDGSAQRDFVHVDDTCTALHALIDAPIDRLRGEVFNVASGEARSVMDIANDIVALTRSDPALVRRIEERPGQVVLHRGDYSKIQALLGWKPTIAWQQGLASTFAWYQQNRAYWERQLKLREIPVIHADGRLILH